MPQVSFGASIKPLFLNIDISQTKSFGVNLGDYMTNADNTNGVLATLAPQNGKPPTMAQVPMAPSRKSLCSSNGKRTDFSGRPYRAEVNGNLTPHKNQGTFNAIGHQRG